MLDERSISEVKYYRDKVSDYEFTVELMRDFLEFIDYYKDILFVKVSVVNRTTLEVYALPEKVSDCGGHLVFPDYFCGRYRFSPLTEYKDLEVYVDIKTLFEFKENFHYTEFNCMDWNDQEKGYIFVDWDKMVGRHFDLDIKKDIVCIGIQPMYLIMYFMRNIGDKRVIKIPIPPLTSDLPDSFINEYYKDIKRIKDKIALYSGQLNVLEKRISNDVRLLKEIQ